MHTTNPTENVLESFFDRITALNGVLHAIEWQSKSALSTLEDRSQKLPDIWHMSRVLLEDIGEIPDDLWRRFHPTSHMFIIKREDAKQAYEDILKRINLFVVSQAYEAFETFLKDSVAYLHHALPATADSQKLDKWARRNGQPASVPEWKRFVRVQACGVMRC